MKNKIFLFALLLYSVFCQAQGQGSQATVYPYSLPCNTVTQFNNRADYRNGYVLELCGSDSVWFFVDHTGRGIYFSSGSSVAPGLINTSGVITGDGSDLNPIKIVNGSAPGQVLVWNGSTWVVQSQIQADRDFLKISTNVPPDSVNGTPQYTKMKTTFGGRVTMPGQDVLVIDSTQNADFIASGFRNAQISAFDNLGSGYTQISQIGNEGKVVIGGNTVVFRIQKATGTNPVIPGTLKSLLVWNEVDSSWYFPTYPDTRDDAITPFNYLSTTTGGRLVSLPFSTLPGGVQAFVFSDPTPNTAPSITPDAAYGPFIAFNDDAGEVWHWNFYSSNWDLAQTGPDIFYTSTEFTGDGAPLTPLALAQQGATVGQALTWNGTQYVPTSVGGGSGVSDSTFVLKSGLYTGKEIDSNVYRTGKTGFASSDTTGTLNINTIPPSGSVLTYAINATTPLRSQYKGPTWAVLSRYNYSRIDLNNMKPNHFPAFKYGVWTEDYFVDSTTNLPLGPGNSIRNWGFNQDGAEPTLSRWLWSTEQNHYAGVTPVWEHHMEVFDNTGRQTRPVKYQGSHDGKFYGAGWRVNSWFFQKPNADLRYGLIVDQNTGLWRTELPFSFRIANDTTVGPIMERLSGGQFRNILGWNNNRSLTVGDSNGIVVVNKIRFLRSSSTPTIYAATGNLFFDSLKLTIITNDINSRYEVVKNVGSANTMEHCFDGSTYFMERNSGALRPVSYDLRAPTYSVALAQNGDFAVGSGSNAGNWNARFRVFDNSDATRALVRLDNSQGSKSIYAHNTPTSLVGTDGDICLTNGVLRGKYLAAWGKYLHLRDANGASTNQVLTWNGGAWAPATPTAITNIYNSNGTFGLARTGTITNFLRFQKVTDAGTGFAPFTIRVGGTAPGLQSWVATTSADSLQVKFDNAKGFLQLSNANITIQNTDALNGIAIDEASKAVITSGGVVRNASNRLDASTNTFIEPENSIVVAQPGATVLTLRQIGTATGNMRQGITIWVTNFSGGVLNITPFLGESINALSTATIPDGKSAWVTCIGPADWAMMVGQ